MNCEDIIKHILINSVTYIEEYSKKESLTDKEKGILMGLYIDVDSIKNHLLTENLKTELDLDKIMSDLQKLIDE